MIFNMEFFDKLTKKATETYKGAAEKTSKIAKETKLKMKISENKSKIDELYKEIGKKVYQKHVTNDNNCIKEQIAEGKKQQLEQEEIEIMKKLKTTTQMHEKMVENYENLGK